MCHCLNDYMYQQREMKSKVVMDALGLSFTKLMGSEMNKVITVLFTVAVFIFVYILKCYIKIT